MAEPFSLSEDERAVYAVAMAYAATHWIAEDEAGPLILNRTTMALAASHRGVAAENVWGDHGPAVGDAFGEYVRRNDQNYVIEDSLTSVARVEVSGLGAVDSVLAAGRPWSSAFRARWPDANGLLTLSRTGFDATGSVAVLEASRMDGPLAGFGVLLLLRKESGRWRVVEEAFAWIS